MLSRNEDRQSGGPERRLSPGALVLIAGPSGAGKDTLIDAARARYAGDGRFVFPLRVITRGEAPGELHVPVSSERFAADEAAGRYLLAWRSHGLAYAIPASVCEDLACGRIVIANVSRTVIARAEELVADVIVLHVTASVETRAARIRSRGREGDGETMARLGRQVHIVTTRSPVVEIHNDGALEDAVVRFTEVLQEVASARREGSGR